MAVSGGKLNEMCRVPVVNYECSLIKLLRLLRRLCGNFAETEARFTAANSGILFAPFLPNRAFLYLFVLHLNEYLVYCAESGAGTY